MRIGLKKHVLCLLVLTTPLAVVNLHGATATPVVLEQTGIRISLGANYRVHGQIKVDGVPFTDQSRLYALRPNAGGRFFGYEDDIKAWADAKVTTAPDGTVRAVYPLRAPNGEFTGTQTHELTTDRRLRFNIDAAFKGTDGRLEHRMGGIFTGWLSGRPYKARMRDGTTKSGTMPTSPTTEDLELSTVVKDFLSLSVETPMGPLEITTSGTLPVRLVDWRRNRYFDAEPLFWLGVSEMPAGRDQRIQYGMEIRFPPARAAAPPVADITMETPLAIDAAYRPAAPRDIIVPTPKKVVWGEGVLDLDPNSFSSPLLTSGDSNTNAFLSALHDKLQKYLREAGAQTNDHARSGGAKIVLKLENSSPAPEEHYRVVVSDGVKITAETTAGLAAGVQSLRQLIRPGSNPGTVALRRCEIDDYATLPFRCIHFFAGANDSPVHIKLIEQVLEPLKLNELCYHADNLTWESHPEIKNPAGNPMTKEEVRKVVAAAQRANIDMVPLVASFGHSEWMLTTPELRQLAENPEFPYAYDPTKPEVYKIVHDLYEEAIDLFKPKYFHIGHDEVDLKGFPQTERLKKIGLRKLFADDVKHYRDWFAQRGIKTVIWGDMLVGPGESPDATLAPSVEEAKLRRESLPKDVIIGDWHYVADPAPTYKSLRILNDAGFDTMAVTWMHPLNVVNFARAAAEANETTGAATYSNPKHGRSIGLIQSTWSQSKTHNESIRRNADQYAAYVLAAEAAWNGGSLPPDQLPYDYRHYFAELYVRDMLPASERPGWKISAAKPVQLSSLFEPAHPAKVTCPVDTSASLLLFDLSATSAGPAEPPIAKALISYDDGTSQSIDWKLGNSVMGREDKRSAPGALLQETQPAADAKANAVGYLHRHVIRTQATKTIKEITFTSANQGPGLIVHAITGVQ